MNKHCKRCEETKLLEDFYVCKGRMRPECKQCTIKQNSEHQKKKKPWRTRNIDHDSHKLYMREYYARNKDKFKIYRERFKEKFPGYFTAYSKKYRAK